MKTIKQLLGEKAVSEVTDNDVLSEKVSMLDQKQVDHLSKFDIKRPAKYASERDMPVVIVLKRKAVRVYPDHQKVALYYTQALDRYISIPFNPKADQLGTLAEDKKDKDEDEKKTFEKMPGEWKKILGPNAEKIRKSRFINTVFDTYKPSTKQIIKMGPSAQKAAVSRVMGSDAPLSVRLGALVGYGLKRLTTRSGPEPGTEKPAETTPHMRDVTPAPSKKPISLPAPQPQKLLPAPKAKEVTPEPTATSVSSKQSEYPSLGRKRMKDEPKIINRSLQKSPNLKIKGGSEFQFKPKRLRESFRDNIDLIREDVLIEKEVNLFLEKVPYLTEQQIEEGIMDLAKKYGPKALKLAGKGLKAAGRVGLGAAKLGMRVAGGIARAGVGAVKGAFNALTGGDDDSKGGGSSEKGIVDTAKDVAKSATTPTHEYGFTQRSAIPVSGPPSSTATPESQRSGFRRSGWLQEKKKDEEDDAREYAKYKAAKATHSKKEYKFSGAAKLSRPEGKKTPESERSGFRRSGWLDESNIKVLKNIVENNIKSQDIQIGERSITVSNIVAKKLVNVYESLNKDNKKKIENMLNESVSSFRKAINFAIRQ